MRTARDDESYESRGAQGARVGSVSAARATPTTRAAWVGVL